MMRINLESLPPFLLNQFEELVIPGSGIGVAIGKESDETFQFVAFGSTETGGAAIRCSGKPLQTDRRKPLSAEQYHALIERTVGAFRQDGLFAADGILDGVTYLVKWCDGDRVIRLVLINPNEIGNDDASQFAQVLEELISEV